MANRKIANTDQAGLEKGKARSDKAQHLSCDFKVFNFKGHNGKYEFEIELRIESFPSLKHKEKAYKVWVETFIDAVRRHGIKAVSKTREQNGKMINKEIKQEMTYSKAYGKGKNRKDKGKIKGG